MKKKALILLILLVLTVVGIWGYNMFVFAKGVKEDAAKQEAVKVSYKFLFPDTVYVNKKYNGEIIYKGILDTISKKVGTYGNVSRFIEYHYTTANSVDISTEQLEGEKLDTVGAVSVDTIPFYNVKFTRLGLNYIDGIIDDGAFLENYYPDGKMRVIANRTRARHKVIVMDSL